MFGRKRKPEPLAEADVRLLRGMQGFCRRHGLATIEVSRGPILLTSSETFGYVDGLGWARRTGDTPRGEAQVIEHPDLPAPDFATSRASGGPSR